MSRDLRLVREPLTKSPGFALKNAKHGRTVTPTAEIPQQAFLSLEVGGKLPLEEKIGKWLNNAHRERVFRVHGTGLMCCEGGSCCFCGSGAVEVEQHRAEQRRAAQECGHAALLIRPAPELPSHRLCPGCFG